MNTYLLIRCRLGVGCYPILPKPKLNSYLFGSISGYPVPNGEAIKGNGVIKGELKSKFGNPSGWKIQGIQGCGISKEPTVGVWGVDMVGFAD